MHYSQNDEQEVLEKIFGDHVGKFLDIGACDGRLNSNTLALVEKGWSGMLVEPSPRAFIKLQELHGDNKKLVLVHTAVVARYTFDMTPFWDGPYAMGYSTTETFNREKWNHLCAFEEKFWIPSTPLLVMVDMAVGLVLPTERTLDFVSIDTEGTSVDLFRVFPFHLVKPKAICVEHDGFIAQCEQVADLYGYHEVSRNAENLIYVRNE